ncbi:MAG: response regulator transcription factor [Betaproteobacteria bacterium]|nr:response regulator transcription factor [Betaproteobacteria bacterium]
MLVDDHAVVRMGFRLLLDTTTDLRVVAECGSGEEALQCFTEVKPDVVVLDLSMGGMGGLEALSRLLAKWPTTRVLVLSAHEDTAHPRRALAAGALGYLPTRSAAAALIEAIRQVAAGKLFLEPALAQEIVVEQVSRPGSPLETLSAREFEVFVMLARGKSVAEIAAVLFLSPRTVGTHLYNIKQKLGAGNAAELTLIAIRNGLIDA